MSTSDVASMRSLSEISEEETVRLSIDLVAAARRNLGFLRLVTESQWLQERPNILESIRRLTITLFHLGIPVFLFFWVLEILMMIFFCRYDQLWMPLISDLSNGSNPPMILPPLDIEWVWYCHTLNPVRATVKIVYLILLCLWEIFENKKKMLIFISENFQ